MAHESSWNERRPIPACAVGVLHAFGPGVLLATNRQVEFRGAVDRRLRMPLRDLRLVCLYGPVRVTTGAVRLIGESGAALAYLSADGGRTTAVLLPTTDDWRRRRYRQYRALGHPEWVVGQARSLVVEKIGAMGSAVRHARRHGKDADGALAQARAGLDECREAAAACTTLDALRGHEGLASRRWFAAFDRLLPDGWTLPGRHRRPPTDPVNALLSFGYTLLFHRVLAACQAWGLDPALGALHPEHPGRMSLACDLMEPFRVEAVDRLVLRALSLRIFGPDDFLGQQTGGAVHLTEPALKRWIEQLESHWHAPPATPFRAEPPQSLQVRLLDRVRRFVEAIPADQDKSVSQS